MAQVRSFALSLMAKPGLGKGLGKLLNGDPVVGGVRPSTPAGIPNSGNGLRRLISQPAPVAEQKPLLPRWYLLLADGILLLAAEGIVLKSDQFGWAQGLLCGVLVLTGGILAIGGILETNSSH